MSLSKIILQPVSSEENLEDYLDTVKTPVGISRIKKHFEINLLKKLYKNKQIPVWGNINDTKGTNANKWKEIVPGDIILFSGKGKFFASATVSSKIHNKNLSMDLWGEDKKGKTREYIYFLDDVRDQKITYAEFNKVAKNTPDFAIRTFSVLDVKKSLLVLKAFGLGEKISKHEEIQELLKIKDNAKNQEGQIHEEEMPESNVTSTEAIRISNDLFLEASRYDRLDPCSDKAIDAYIKCLRYNNKHIDAYTNLGLINLENKDYEEALTCFQKIINLQPDSPDAKKTLKYIYSQMDCTNIVGRTESQVFRRTVYKDNIEKPAFPKTIIVAVILALLIGVGGFFIKPVKLLRLFSNIYHQKTTSKPGPEKTTEKATDIQKTTPQKPPKKIIRFYFRNTKWGMTKEQVKAIETMKIVYEKKTAILYHGEIEGLETTAHYIFKEEKLVGGMQRYIGKHIDDNDYILDYKKTKDALTHKYGAPVTDEQRWSNDEYKDNPQDWGFAIRSGDLVFRSSWKSKYTDVNLGLYSSSYNQIIHAVSYTNKEHERSAEVTP